MNPSMVTLLPADAFDLYCTSEYWDVVKFLCAKKESLKEPPVPFTTDATPGDAENRERLWRSLTSHQLNVLDEEMENKWAQDLETCHHSGRHLLPQHPLKIF